MLVFLQELSIVLFIISFLIYILIIIREKIYIKKNIIVIENKYLTKEDIEEVDVSEFVVRGIKVRSGDEIKIITSNRKTLNGTLIGGNKRNKAIHMITFDNKIKKLEINKIKKFKITSKYGKFLN